MVTINTNRFNDWVIENVVMGSIVILHVIIINQYFDKETYKYEVVSYCVFGPL